MTRATYISDHEYFTEKLSGALADSIEDPAVALSAFIELERYGFRYIDRISSLVAAEYVAELDRRQNQARAEERRGRPATIRIAELHAALLVCRVLGPSVLRESSSH